MCPPCRTQYDPKLQEHGYVRATYKETLHDPEVKRDVQWHPLIFDASVGQRVTDPKGLLFMAEDLVVDLEEAAPIEHWKHGDVGAAEGLTKRDVWKERKVMSDILDHTMLSFSQDVQDQWRALSSFHKRFRCSDEVPNLPLTLRAGVSRDMLVYFALWLLIHAATHRR